MADRQDIDALLIDALYGELEGPERERLEAHLVSHPQDRAALEDMKSTRAMYRDASSAFGSSEPAPAISAKLLQEAARRAPAPKAAAGAGIMGWFASLLRPFIANPALSAATAVVVVGGAAGVMYANGRFRTTQPEQHVAESQQGWASGSGAGAPTPDRPGAAAGTAAGTSFQVALDEAGEAARFEQANLADQERIEALAKKDADGTLSAALLDDTRADKRQAAASAVADPDPADLQLDYRATSGKDLAKKESGAAMASAPESARPTAAKAGGKGYLEVDKNAGDEPRVRELDDDAVEGEKVASPFARGSGGAGSSGAPPGTATSATTGAVAPKSPTPGPSAAPPPPPSITTQKPTQPSRDAGRTPVYDAKADAQLTAWARDQHARMAKLVAAGKCNDAGTVGAEISRKAPEYYQSNVANDRAVRACRSYVERARRAKQQEEAKSRAGRTNDARVDSYEAPAPTTSR